MTVKLCLCYFLGGPTEVSFTCKQDLEKCGDLNVDSTEFRKTFCIRNYLVGEKTFYPERLNNLLNRYHEYLILRLMFVFIYS